jgi:hypothetical protein
MSNKHHLTLAEFIRVYVTTQGDDGYGDRPTIRAKRLADAIYTRPEVLEALRQHPASGSLGIVTVKPLRKEMKELEEAGDMFSAYRVDCGNQNNTESDEDDEEPLPMKRETAVLISRRPNAQEAQAPSATEVYRPTEITLQASWALSQVALPT